VVRNAFGRQRESFEADLQLEEFGRVRAVFIGSPPWGPAPAPC
jgi:5'-phosphate synthase pdxT subunit